MSPLPTEATPHTSQLAAILFLILLAAAPLVALIILNRRSHFSLFQWLLWVTAFLLCKLLWRTRWAGPLPVVDGQGAVIVCNHRSSVDPFFVQTATIRKTHWLVAREYCEHPALCWFLSACEVIPTRRAGIDTAATKAAIRIASRGGLVGMLPEGRINMTPDFMLPVRPGAALVALKARVPVVPCYIEGSPYRGHVASPFFLPARVMVHFGPSIDLSDFYGREQEDGVLADAMDRILKSLAALAGRPDYQPELAGRNWKPMDAESATPSEDED